MLIPASLANVAHVCRATYDVIFSSIPNKRPIFPKALLYLHSALWYVVCEQYDDLRTGKSKALSSLVLYLDSISSISGNNGTDIFLPVFLL